jgi:hypothetical protein
MFPFSWDEAEKFDQRAPSRLFKGYIRPRLTTEVIMSGHVAGIWPCAKNEGLSACCTYSSVHVALGNCWIRNPHHPAFPCLQIVRASSRTGSCARRLFVLLQFGSFYLGIIRVDTSTCDIWVAAAASPGRLLLMTRLIRYGFKVRTFRIEHHLPFGRSLARHG